MGGAVSSGRDNNELIDNLMGGNYIRTRGVERVFRALDRAEYMTPESRDQAYKDLAWRNGQLHISAPCIYSEVMEGLELKPGLSFLNIGSGTGYLSTLAGLVLGSSGINHGIEIHSMVVEYANKKLSQFIDNSPTLDEFDFCEPKFYHGNGLCLAPLQTLYDRVYCGAGCPEEYQNYFKQLIKVGGILVMPLNDNLVQVRRVAAAEWSSRTLLNVSFATLVAPTDPQRADPLRLEELSPARLQALCRGAVRGAVRGALLARHAGLRGPPPRAPPAKRACPRRVCIPLDDRHAGDDEGLNGLHDLDRTNGGAEMNALLSLVLRMGHNRVAGALRFDPLDSDSDEDLPLRSSDFEDETDTDDHGDHEDDDDDDDRGDDGDGDRPDDDSPPPVPDRPPCTLPEGGRRVSDPRNIVYFGFERRAPPPAAPAAAPGSGDAPQDCEDSTEDKTEENTKEPRKSQDRMSKKRSSKDSKGRNKDKSTRSSKDAGPRSAEKCKEGKTDEENPDVPAEVEIYLGKASEAAGSSAMEWDNGKAHQWSDEETTESTSKAKEEKRQKLDSGLGESSPASASGSAGSGSGLGERAASPASPPDDEGKGRRRRQKRSLCARDSSTESSSEGARPGRGAGGPGAEGGERGAGDDARRVRLSVLMKRAVRDLPLPYAMKIYLNYGRCFQV